MVDLIQRTTHGTAVSLHLADEIHSPLERGGGRGAVGLGAGEDSAS
jgi:hypothetical protein